MKTLKIGVGALLFFALVVVLTSFKKDNNYSHKYNNLKGGETQTESPFIID